MTSHLLVARDLVDDALGASDDSTTQRALSIAAYALDSLATGGSDLSHIQLRDAADDSLTAAMQAATRPSVAIEAQVARTHLRRSETAGVERGYDARLRVDGGDDL